MLPEEAVNVHLLVDGYRVLQQGNDHVLVQSKTAEDEWHSVEWDEERVDWVCTCPGYTFRGKCKHSKAVSNWAGGVADVKYAVDLEEAE